LKIGDLDALYHCMFSTSREIQGFPRPLLELAAALVEIMVIRQGKDNRKYVFKILNHQIILKFSVFNFDIVKKN